MGSALEFLTRYSQDGDEFLDSIPFASSPKETSRWEKFNDDDEVPEEVMSWFNRQAAELYDSGIQKLIPRLNKCLDNAGDYVEK